MTDWQPIETAPRDPDKLIDLWIIPGRMYNSRYREKPHRVADAHSSENGKYWIKDGKFIEGGYHYDDERDECFDPDDRGPDATIVTHWMPLPDPPNGKNPA